MKRLLLASFLLTVLTVLPLLGIGHEAPAPPESTAAPVPLGADRERKITLLRGDKTVKLSVSDYLHGVLAAEMPVSFEPEALRAQAVAARSYLERGIKTGRHENADICDSPDCCQAYLSDDELRKSWGKNYDAYIALIDAAVSDTDGEYLSYGGEAAFCAFHSSSAGATEASAEVWNEVPYLVSVSSPESSEDVPGYVSRLELKDIDFRDTILYARPDADMTGEPDTWIGKTEINGSGRVGTMVIGGEEFTGVELRELFSLRSAAFTVAHEDGRFVFSVTGYGHGVGMSQYGANVMAKQGHSYTEILSHYYPGTVIVS